MPRFMRTLQGKLIASVALGVIVLVVVALRILASMDSTLTRFEELSREEYYVKGEVDAMNVEFKRQVQEWKNLLIRGFSDSTRVDDYWVALGESHAEVQARAQDLLSRLPEGEIRRRVATFARAHEALLSQYEDGKEAFVQSGYNITAGDKAVAGIDRPPSQAMSDLSKFISRHAETVINDLVAENENAAWIAAAQLLAVAVVLLAGLVWALRRQFIQPLQLIVSHIRRLAAGDFSGAMQLNRDDELGRLSADLQRMQEDLGGLIDSIRTTAEALNLSAAGLNRSAQTITETTTETDSCSGMVAASIAEMVQTVNEVARSAAGASEASQAADGSARDGLGVMTNALTALNEVAGQVSGIADDVLLLEESTSKVGSVLDVIKGIAEQTNLLALNAAIEAARAGEQGRGFAVVADEVRALAQRTQESTEEIHSIIDTVQVRAAGVAKAMLGGKETTAGAVHLAEQAGGHMEAITGSVAKVMDMNHHIAAASEEQSVAADEISRNVATMAELAESAKRASVETHDTTLSLEQTARDLTALVGRFRV